MPAPNAYFQTAFGNMTDSQLRQTISQLSTAASLPGEFQAFASPTPLPAHSRSQSTPLVFLWGGDRTDVDSLPQKRPHMVHNGHSSSQNSCVRYKEHSCTCYEEQFSGHKCASGAYAARLSSPFTPSSNARRRTQSSPSTDPNDTPSAPLYIRFTSTDRYDPSHATDPPSWLYDDDALIHPPRRSGELR
jgi:hypothetical protein